MATATPKEIAQEWDTDARTLRKFLRSDAKANSTETPGKGSRWAIERKALRTMRKRFDAWNAANEAKKAESDTDAETTEPAEVDATD